eukprot:2365921-Pyramimonas_sp.AAC.1
MSGTARSPSTTPRPHGDASLTQTVSDHAAPRSRRNKGSREDAHFNSLLTAGQSATSRSRFWLTKA